MQDDFIREAYEETLRMLLKANRAMLIAAIAQLVSATLLICLSILKLF